MERKTRSILKTVSWRLTASATTMVLVLLVTGRIQLALQIGALEIIAKLVLFYLHERAWNNICWGRGVVVA